jgi:hypothetical protein
MISACRVWMYHTTVTINTLHIGICVTHYTIESIPATNEHFKISNTKPSKHCEYSYTEFISKMIPSSGYANSSR